VLAVTSGTILFSTVLLLLLLLLLFILLTPSSHQQTTHRINDNGIDKVLKGESSTAMVG